MAVLRVFTRVLAFLGIAGAVRLRLRESRSAETGSAEVPPMQVNDLPPQCTKPDPTLDSDEYVSGDMASTEFLPRQEGEDEPPSSEEMEEAALFLPPPPDLKGWCNRLENDPMWQVIAQCKQALGQLGQRPPTAWLEEHLDWTKKHDALETMINQAREMQGNAADGQNVYFRYGQASDAIWHWRTPLLEDTVIGMHNAPSHMAHIFRGEPVDPQIWENLKEAEFEVTKIHLMPACEDTLRAYQALLIILSETQDLGIAVGKLKLIPTANIEYYLFSTPAATVVIYCRESASRCLDVAAGISDQFKKRFPDIYWRARAWRFPRFNFRVEGSRLVFAAQGNANTKDAILRHGRETADEDIASFWMYPPPTAQGLAAMMTDYEVWDKMRTTENRQQLLHDLGPCPHGWCYYNDICARRKQPCGDPPCHVLCYRGIMRQLGLM